MGSVVTVLGVRDRGGVSTKREADLMIVICILLRVLSSRASLIFLDNGQFYESSATSTSQRWRARLERRVQTQAH